MSTYRPKQRSLSAAVYTSAGWVSGTFLLPPVQGFLDYLNQTKNFIKLTDATLLGRSQTPFFALQRSAVLVIVPDQHDTNLQARMSLGSAASHRIHCLMKGGLIAGTLETAPNLRVSDYLMQHTDFIALHDCSWNFGTTAGAPEVPQPVPFVAVHAGSLVGVSEGTGA